LYNAVWHCQIPSSNQLLHMLIEQITFHLSEWLIYWTAHPSGVSCSDTRSSSCLIIKLLSWHLVTDNKHLSLDPQLSSVNQNCQIYSMQLDAQKTGIFKLKEFMIFTLVRRNILLNNLYSFVSPNLCFKETRSINFFPESELSSTLYTETKI